MILLSIRVGGLIKISIRNRGFLVFTLSEGPSTLYVKYLRGGGGSHCSKFPTGPL